MVEDKESLQKEVDSYLEDKKSPIRSFVIYDKKGDCKIPHSVHIRFKNCTFKSFSAVEGNNNFYFENCKFDNADDIYTIKSGRVIFYKCNISAKIALEYCKAELLNSDISQTIELDVYSYLKSIKNVYSSDDDKKFNKKGISVLNNSRCESSYDSFLGWSEAMLFASDNSVIKASYPVINSVTKRIAQADFNSLIKLYQVGEISAQGAGSEESASIRLFVADNGSRIEISESAKISSRGKFLAGTNGSSFKVKNVKEIQSTTDSDVAYFDFDSSSAEIISTDKVTCSKATFCSLKNGSNVKIFNLNKITTSGSIPVFDLDSSELSIINKDKKDVVYNNAIKDFCIAKSSKLYFKNIDKILAAAGTFDLDFCDLTLLNCAEVKAQGGFGISALNSSKVFVNNTTNLLAIDKEAIIAENSLVRLSNFKTINSTGAAKQGIKLTNSKLVASGGTNIEGVTGYALWADGSSVSIVNTTNIKGKTAIYLKNSNNIFFKNIDQIKGLGSKGIDGTTGSKNNLTFINVKSIEGEAEFGMSLMNSDLTVKTLRNSDTKIKGPDKGLVLLSGLEGKYTANLEGPITLTGSSSSMEATRYILNEKGVVFSGNVITTKCLRNTTYSSFSAGVKDTGSITNLIRTTTTGKTELYVNAVFNPIKCVFTDNVLSSASVVTTTLSELKLGFSDVINSTYLGLLTKVSGNISSLNSFVGQFGGSFGTVVGSGKSTVLAGALSSGSVRTKDYGTKTITAAFSTEFGDTLVHTANTLIERAAQYDGYFNNTYYLVSVNQANISSVQSEIFAQAATKITTVVGGSSIVVDTSKVDINN